MPYETCFCISLFFTISRKSSSFFFWHRQFNLCICLFKITLIGFFFCF
nr:MAG TPA: hypothetical protein [Caudoviricetes sp.]